jgi:TonB family protein
MILLASHLRRRSILSSTPALAGVLFLVFAEGGFAQQTTPANAPPQAAQPAATTDTTPPAAPTPGPAQDAAPQQAALPQTATPPPAGPSQEAAPSAGTAEAAGGITEDQLRQMLVGKPLFLRGGYLSDNLSFNEHGVLNGQAPHASYTLCAVQFDKVHLTTHKVELTGARYGLHFLGALPYEDPTNAVDRVKITPKKKMVKVSIDREIVVKPKKVKAARKEKGKPTTDSAKAADSQSATASAEAGDADQPKPDNSSAPAAPEQAAGQPESSRKADTTTSPAHARKVLKEAIDKVFAESVDERMVEAMPDFWRFYYQAAAAKTDYKPTDAAVLRQAMVDQKAKLLSTFEPASNEYAQANGVAGVALYHAVIGPDGQPGEIAVARPIGFGLDENAVEAIRNAKFQPAVKDGKPVPVLLDLVVQFRIYSKRTAAASSTETADQTTQPAAPGPYSVQH